MLTVPDPYGQISPLPVEFVVSEKYGEVCVGVILGVGVGVGVIYIDGVGVGVIYIDGVGLLVTDGVILGVIDGVGVGVLE
jgi:hypothetical protein